jgi:hypothetical protein
MGTRRIRRRKNIFALPLVRLGRMLHYLNGILVCDILMCLYIADLPEKLYSMGCVIQCDKICLYAVCR